MKTHKGFTTVELLVTLFIAALFLAAGYQLYVYVMRNDASVRSQSIASDVAYQYLNQYAAQAAGGPCAASTPLSAAPITVSSLVNTSITVTISCPNTNVTAVSRVDVVLAYNQPQQKVEYSTYSKASANAVTAGLVSQWTLDGNANDSVGGNNGTVSGATLTTGQGGRANGAYNFSSSSSTYITMGSPAALQLTNALSISAWVNPTGTFNGAPGIVNYGTGGYWFALDSSGHPITVLYDPSNNTGSTAASTVLTHQWYLLTTTYDGTTIDIYINGVLAKSASAGISSLGGYATASFYIGSIKNNAGHYFDGAIDDVRVYNRALSQTEVQQLFTNGAQ